MPINLSCPISERGLLSGLYKHGSEAFFEVSSIINEECFTIDSNAIIYKILKQIIERDNNVKIDIPLVFATAKELNLDNILSRKDERDHLQAVISLPVQFENIQKFAKKIKKLFIIRQLKNKCIDIAENKLQQLTGEESITQILGITDEIIDYTSVIGKSEDAAEKLSTDIDEFVQDLIDNPVYMSGYSTGWKIFDQSIGDGMLPGCLHVLGARTGIGKSLICDNIATYTSRQLGLPTLIVDTELLKSDHIFRCLALLSEVPIKEIKTGKFGKNIIKLKKIKEAKEKLKKSNLHYLNVANLDFLEQLSSIRRWIMREVGLYKDGTSKPCIIFYDYLKMSDTQGLSNNVSEHQLLGIQTTQLLNIAVKFQRPSILLTVQLNRSGVSLEDQSIIAKSDAILHPATSFSVFKNLTAEEISETSAEYTHKMITLKARHSGGLAYNEYILYKMSGNIGLIREGKTNLDLLQNPHDNTQSGFIVSDENKKDNPNYNELRDSFANAEDVIPK